MAQVSYERVSPQTKRDWPALPAAPFRLVLLSMATTTQAERKRIAEWLAASACRYFMAWGEDCRAWQDALNLASLRRSEFGKIPDADIVITTAHPDESLQDVFWFARYTAMHPCHPLPDAVLLQVGGSNNEDDVRASFANA